MSLCRSLLASFALSVFGQDQFLTRGTYSNDVVGESPIAVIGAGFSGLSAALELRLLGHEVVMFEKSDHVGGRGYQWSEKGFTFDAGPSWYWMPHVFEDIFAKHGRHSSEFYNLTRLDPAYVVYFGEDDKVDVPGDLEGLKAYIKGIEPESAACVDRFFEDGKTLYEKGIDDWIWKPMVSLSEVLDISLVRAALEFNMFGSFETEVQKCVKDERLRTILKWPVIFLGASPKDAPAMYSLMTYAGHADGTWYPDGGMSAPGRALAQTARDAGVTIKLNAEIDKLDIVDGTVVGICSKDGGCDAVSGVVASGDYHWTEQTLLPKEFRKYDEKYWDNQAMSPSVLLYYVGIDKVLPLKHHTFFFDDKLDESLHASIDEHRMEEDPVFYVTSTSQVDPATAPKDGSALFILVPISYKLNGTDTQEARDAIFNSVVRRMEKDLGSFSQDIVYKRDYGPTDFENEFHAFRGNAFGHANILEQSLLFKPSMDSLLENLVFAGHLTNPGPGIPPALASGATAARLLHTKLSPPWLTAQSALVGFAVFLALCRYSLRTELQRSRRACIRLFYDHGRTFFAGASLMAPQQFLDTAAVYGLMRIADDCVDDVDDFEERRRRLDEFEGIFWRCWRAKSASEADHPVMPAVIETSMRLGYPDNFFERFFKAMRSDITENTCETWDDAIEYIEGSAAVVGEFMLPILMPDASVEEIDKARPHAKDLGRAFQLTNFSRDIDEDLDIQRQYIPVELCKKHGVDLRKRTSQQDGFPEMMEEMYKRCDDYYASGDLGVAILPERIRPVVLVASKLYQSIQDEVRQRNYNVFEERCRVPTKKKMKVASELVEGKVVMQMVAAEVLLLTVFALNQITVPFCLLVAVWQFCEHFSWPGLTYAGFHCIFTLPALAVVTWLAWRSTPSPAYFKLAWKFSALLCVVATIWTTPWDNYLVYRGVWGYPDVGHVLGVIGYVPIEEYAFFSIETCFVCMVWVCQGGVEIIPHFRKRGPARFLGLVAFAALFASSLYMLTTQRAYYLGLIISWSTPILAIQWAFGADALMAQKESWMRPLFISWMYLCVIDRWAIQNGCWSINVAQTLPRFDSLPMEEAYFFLVTSTMCTWGLQLAMNVCTLDCGFAVAVRRVISWARKEEKAVAWEWTAARWHLLGLLMVSGASFLFLQGMSQQSQVFMMAVPTLLVSLPFGKVAMVMGDWMQIRSSKLFAMYIGATASVALGWLLCPYLALAVSVGSAMLHFGLNDTKGRSGNLPVVDLITRGGMLSFAVKCQPDASAWIMKQLVPGSLDGPMHALMVFSSIHLVCLVVSVTYHAMKCHKSHHMEMLLEQVILTAVFAGLPPLLSFTIYINAVYTPRFLLRASQLSAVHDALDQFWRKNRSTTVTALMAAVLCITVFVQSSQRVALVGATDSADGGLCKAVLILLSIISTPHMMLMSFGLDKTETPGAISLERSLV